MPIRPGEGLQALEHLLSSTANAAVTHVIGRLHWPAILKAPARQANPLFDEIKGPLSSSRGQEQKHILELQGKAKPVQRDLLAEIQQILTAVLGRMPEANEPLMEVHLSNILQSMTWHFEHTKPPAQSEIQDPVLVTMHSSWIAKQSLGMNNNVLQLWLLETESILPERPFRMLASADRARANTEALICRLAWIL